MVELYLNKNEIKKNLQDWLSSIFIGRESWGGNNLHIDEIGEFKKIGREDWILSAFSTFQILIDEIKIPSDFLVFLHIGLSYSAKNSTPENISLNWIINNLDEFTPPSFNCTTVDYYKNFYAKNLVPCKVDNTILELFSSKDNLKFLYRSYYDNSESMSSRELYVFNGYLPK